MVHKIRGLTELDYIVSVVKQLFYVNVIAMLLTSIMPNEKYQKILKNVCGLITILILTGPFLKIADLEETFQKIYNSAVQNQQLWDVKINEKIYGENISNNLIEQCQTEIEKNITEMIIEDGLYPSKLQVDIEKEPSNNNYGSIQSINVCVSEKEQNVEDKDEALIKIAAVSIDSGERKIKKYTDEKTDSLSEKIASCYGLDKSMVVVCYRD